MEKTLKEKKVLSEFMEEIEQHTYTRKEIVDKHMAKAVKFFIVESGLEKPLERLIENLRNA